MSTENSALFDKYIGIGAYSMLTELAISPDEHPTSDILFAGIKRVSDIDELSLHRESSFYTLRKIERALTEKFNFSKKHNLPGIKRNVTILNNGTPEHLQTSFSLTDSAVKTTLDTLTPYGLLGRLGIESIEQLPVELTLRAALALTRHTEDESWSKQYQKILSGFTASEFSNKPVNIITIDSNIFDTVAANSLNKKPWGMSHSKETGIIFIFTKDNEAYPTPNLLQLSVYLHYLYEINFASLFFTSKASSSEHFGAAVVKLIKNSRKPLSFLRDKNVYDETLYWDKALTQLKEYWLDNSYADYIGTTDAIATNTAIISLNFVDLLWSLNIENSCTYHLQQSLWCELIKDYSQSESAYEQRIIENLPENDTTMTKALLETA